MEITGFSQGPKVLATDRALALARARAAEAVIKGLYPGITVTLKAKTETTVGSNVRRVLVTFVLGK